jgi:hypothetical protein
MDGRSRGRQPRWHRRYRSRQHKHAIERAFTGAKLYMGLPVGAPTTQRAAADLVGSTINYVVAATTILQSEDQDLIDRVVAGHIPVLQAAANVRKRAELITALRRSTSTDRAHAGATVGVDLVWDEMVAPSL